MARTRREGAAGVRREVGGTQRARARRVGVAALAASAVLGVAATASAQEIQLTGPLKGAPAVRQLRLYREGRIELAPSASFTLLDEYRRTIFIGARLQYNLKDWLGLGVWGGFGVASLTTDLTDKINDVSPRNEFTAANVNPNTNNGFQDQTSKLQWIAAPQVQLVPFRGKLAIFQKLFVDTDAYLHGGIAFVGVQERGACGAAGQKACTAANSYTLESRTAIAPTFGLGLNFYLAGNVSLGLEYRAFPFAWNRAGFDSRGSGNDARFPDGKVDAQDQTFRFNQMITVSVGLFLQSRGTSD